ncbi:outer membrane lipoprotein LolB [Orbus hercynius]|uniref:Outer-membrane lipoprotein LolB n=1 Tax=Orbus hercynius TaxID=593135 RepID=A0A495RJ84_9GAMM|nr:lipoprotein insertase outer membrane protein LolB [Orbus hercynius]RKS87603.1 outer membrane lipoprotein LolB [Orbus hercynius]
MRLFSYGYRAIVMLLIGALLVACANQPNEQSQQLANKSHQAALSQLINYQATGSLSYITDSTKYYGRFFINQISDNQYQLKLTTPVGTSIFSLTVTPYLAELTDRNGKKYTDENVERLVAKLTGMNIPFKSLHNWFKGVSDNPSKDILDSKGRLSKTMLMQDNQTWLMTITKYDTYSFANKTIDLPAVIELTNQQNQLKMTINNWKLN